MGKDLVITKTYNGLRIKIGCSDIANKYDKHYRISTAEEESRNIDAYIAEVPLTIKPLSYKSKQNKSSYRACCSYIVQL